MRLDELPERLLCHPRRVCVVIVCCVLVFVSGCVQATPTPEPVIISFAFGQWEQEYYERLIELFNEQYPYITVAPRVLRNFGQVDNVFQEGSVDTFFIYDNSDTLPSLFEQGLLLNLTPFVEQGDGFDIEDYYPAAVASCRLEGQIWAIPASVDLEVLYYNKGLFDQNNIPYPHNGWAWGEFMEAAVAISNPDEDIYACAPDAMSVIPFIYQHGGRLLNNWENPSRTTFDDPLVIEALEWYAQLIHEYHAIPTPEELVEAFGQNRPDVRMWQQGKAGMYFGSLWDKGGEMWGRSARWDWEWGMVTLPRDRQEATMGSVQSYAISAETEHPDACWKWVTFLSDQMHYRLMPARRSQAESVKYEEQAGAEEVAVTLASIDHALILFASHSRLEEVAQQYAAAFESIASGEMRVADAMIQAQEQSTFK
jgi:ABC-type glycerol-3-phosphate transport system substrate-binding protein